MFTSDNDELFCAKVVDSTELCFVRQKRCFLPFMSERKQALAQTRLKAISFENYCFFGGYENSERNMLGFFPDNPILTEFPVSALELSFRKCDKLTHRDFLGAVMALGIERETVGDILVEDGRCVIFVKTELKDYITSQLFKAGNVGVKFNDADLSDLPEGRGKTEKSFTVSSLRLDNIVSAVCGYSREKTRNIILSGNVCINYLETQNVSKILKVNDILTVRGMGKFILSGVLGQTKKGRIKISIIYFR
ncbi:MAG: YlmH/Sll1252 family protein [Clostridiales bacterium]|nr:YlmH/Sll1252 family protein [Clostridiales bacterium]